MATTDLKLTTARFGRGLTYFVYAVVVMNEIILVLGFFLKLFGANPDAGFVEWAYRNLERVMAPFRGMFPPVVASTGADVEPVFDTSILFAMMIYGILAMVLRSLIDWLAYRIAVIDARKASDESAAQMAAQQQQQQLEMQRQAAIASGYPAPGAPTVPPGTYA